MDLMHVIYQLRRERDELVEAIRSLERLQAATTQPKRGRPPKDRKSLPIPTHIQVETKVKGSRQSKAHVTGGVN